MEAVLRRVLPQHDLDYRTVDVDADDQLLARYSDVVPGLLLDDREVARIGLTRRRLETIVSQVAGS